jgi:PAS domain S-box-containing protein
VTISDDRTRRWFESSEGFRLLVESVADYAIFMLEPDGTIATWNIGAERAKGYRAPEIIGKHFSVFYPEDEVRAGKCDLELRVATAVGRFEEEGWRVRKDGTRFWANVVITAMRDPDGELIGFAKVTRDLTDRRRAEEQRAARMVAEEANRAKDEFLAMLGHELRNPMAPILTALQLMKLRSGAPSREQEIIERQVRYMTTLVDDLLDVSRITRGKIELARTPVDLRAVIANAVEVASPLLEQRTHHLEISAPFEPLTVLGDEARLTQVFSNLLTNAAKYTPPGGYIAVRFDQGPQQVAVCVTDDGVGIDATLLPRIFELFVQGHQGVERSAGGLGLGLTLVKALVEYHGGSVVAESGGPGNGSTFTVRLPLADAAQVAESSPARSTSRLALVARPRRILLVDDNADAREMLVEALSLVGHEVRSAPGPVEALELVRTYTPEVAVLDIGLPVMDGYELAARLAEQLTETPWLIALTGYGQPQDQARSAGAGFSAHLVKPIDVRHLLEQIEALG